MNTRTCRVGCSGCPSCSAEMLAVLKMKPREYARWLASQSAKTARESRYAMRMAEGRRRHSQEDQDHLDAALVHIAQAGADTSTLDGMAEDPEMNEADQSPRRSAARHRSNAAPDSYAPGIAKMRAARGFVDKGDDDTVDAIVQMHEFREAFRGLASTSLAAAHVPTTSEAHLMPPNPWSEEALKAHREGRR
jgi:hypothetical protein